MGNTKFLDNTDRIILVLVFLSAVTGVWGWELYYRASGETISPDAAIYKSLQLFVFNVDLSNSPIPLPLNIARFFSPFILATAIIRKLVAATSQQLDILRVRLFFRNHYIVCGLGAVGYQIAQDCLASGVKVVVIEKNPENPGIPEIISKGGIVFTGDATDRNLLKKTRPGYAAAVFAVTDEDPVNLQIFISCQSVNPMKRPAVAVPELRYLIHIAESATIKMVYEGDACQKAGSLKGLAPLSGATVITGSEQPGNPDYYLKPFNINQIAAEKVLNDYPPDRWYEVNSREASPLHILIIGLGNIGENLLVSFARTAHYRCNIPDVGDTTSVSRKNTVHLVDTNAVTRLGEIRALYPGIDDVVDCRIVSEPTRSFNRHHLETLIRENGIRLVYLGLEEDNERFMVTHMLQEYRLRNELQVVSLIPTHSLSPVSALTSKETVSEFNILGETCRKAVLINEKLDETAIRINSLYSNGNQKTDAAAAEKAWKSLNENLKQSNRFIAAHIPVKVRAMNLDPDTCSSDEIRNALRSDPALFEDLEHVEHIRFVAERILAGWVPATGEQGNLDKAALKKLKESKINRTLKPFRHLNEADREFNRNFLLNIHELF